MSQRQRARINTEVAVRELEPEPRPVDQVLDRLRDIQTLAIYGAATEYTLNEIRKLSAAGIQAARELKR